MDFGVMAMVGPKRWVPFAQAAEAAGFESLWVPEHLIMPVHMTGAPNTPHAGEPPINASTPAFDPWVQLATIAAVTEKVRLGTNVYNIGLRHPFITARSLTTLDNVSGGRVVLGVGASWLRQEWEAMELPFEGRGRRVDETIQVIQRLCTEDEIAHEGEHFRFPAVGFQPKPVQKPWPPMLIGGDSPAAMRRAAQLGDGWIPMDQTADTLPGNLEKIQRMREEAGRSGPFEVTMSARVTSLDDVKRHEDAGATRLVMGFDPRDREALQRFGGEIIANA